MLLMCKLLYVIGAKNRSRLSHIATRLFKPLLKRRCKIIDRNLQFCFPGLSRQQRLELARKNTVNTISGYLETFVSWASPLNYYRRDSRIVNACVIDRAKEKHCGVILMGGHFTSLDIAGIVATEKRDIYISYQPHKSAMMDTLINTGRLRWAKGIVSTKDVRAMINILKSGGILWIAPDQDLGLKGGRFSDFFGIKAASSNSVFRIAKMTNSAVIPTDFYAGKTLREVTLRYHAALPLLDESDFLERYHRFLESSIKHKPDQYLWAHRRFKTRPEGEMDFYQGEFDHVPG
ncbi:lysophospholipid acyltransferase family protein [Pseudoteredinibacter isoporae]|nr:lysophospholipid acyltransferase family protein [Pseudoteredinibacter isoporae]